MSVHRRTFRPLISLAASLALVLGVLVALIGRAPALAKPLWWITIVLAAIAAYLALNKPF